MSSSWCALLNKGVPLCGTYDMGRFGTSYTQLFQCVILIHAFNPSNMLSLLHWRCSHTHKPCICARARAKPYTCARDHTKAHILCVAIPYSSNFNLSITYIGKFVLNFLSSNINVPPPVLPCILPFMLLSTYLSWCVICYHCWFITGIPYKDRGLDLTQYLHQ